MSKTDKFKRVGKLKNSEGTVINPEAGGLKIILSFSNLNGNSDGPLFDVLGKKWKQVSKENRMWYINKTGSYKLGAVLSTAVQSDVWVVHMLCQKKDMSVDESALEQCIKQLLILAKSNKASFHVSSILLDIHPKLKDLITDLILDEGFDITIYKDS